MATATNCDGTEIQLTLSVAISEAITSWTDVACLYETETEKTLDILGQYFLTHNQFIASDAEIKYYIERRTLYRPEITRFISFTYPICSLTIDIVASSPLKLFSYYIQCILLLV